MELRRIVLVAVFVSVSIALAAQALTVPQQSAIGHWQIIKNGSPSGAEVITYLEGGKLLGKIIKVDTGKDPNKLCDKCSGEYKNQKIMGMIFLRGFTPETGGEGWSGGTVVDPDNGKEYQGKIKAIGKDQLNLRGFVGISLFGRTETWKRIP